jgi:putative (di)nucleoside polyphosphate hydrolase
VGRNRRDRKQRHHPCQTREELLYDLPDHLIGKLWKGKYRGQRQHWMLVRFTEQMPISIAAAQTRRIRGVEMGGPRNAARPIVPFKKRVYRSVLEEFRALI